MGGTCVTLDEEASPSSVASTHTQTVGRVELNSSRKSKPDAVPDDASPSRATVPSRAELSDIPRSASPRESSLTPKITATGSEPAGLPFLGNLPAAPVTQKGGLSLL
jgi:hypothetical protein